MGLQCWLMLFSVGLFDVVYILANVHASIMSFDYTSGISFLPAFHTEAQFTESYLPFLHWKCPEAKVP